MLVINQSLWKVDNDNQIYRFEETGAKAVTMKSTLSPPAPREGFLSPTGTTAFGSSDNPNPILLKHHFETGILWHVSGMGVAKASR